jgi:LPXTG-motif cell wall-anchored protein
MRVLGIKMLMAAAVVTLAALLVTPRLSVAQPVEPYCCVCGPCTSGVSRICDTVVATGGEAAACAGRCALKACQFVEVLEGSCGLHADACTPSPAPAASHSVLLALGLLLTGGGVYLVRRRMVR